jgi:hypothetical protein
MQDRTVGTQRTVQVNPHALALEIRSQVPCTGVVFNGAAVGGGDAWAGRLGVRPMGRRALASRLEVTLVPAMGAAPAPGLFDLELLGQGFPAALWSPEAGAAGVPDGGVLRGVVCGLRVTLDKAACERVVIGSLAPMTLAQCVQGRQVLRPLIWPAAPPADPLPAPMQQTLAGTLWGNDGVSRRRGLLLGMLSQATGLPLRGTPAQGPGSLEIPRFQAAPCFAAPGEPLSAA